MQIQICIGKQTIGTGFVKPLFVGLLSYTDCFLEENYFCFDLVFAQQSHLYDDYEGDLLP